MSENIYKQARLKAAEKKPELDTVERTYPHLCISREKLLMIEQSDPNKRRTDPAPQDVKLMAELYGAPELCDYYCTHQCPIKRGEKPLLHDNLSEISASLMSSMHFLDNANDRIHSILGDSIVSDDEKTEFCKIMGTLKDIAYSAESLLLWAERNGFDRIS